MVIRLSAFLVDASIEIKRAACSANNESNNRSCSDTDSSKLLNVFRKSFGDCSNRYVVDNWVSSGADRGYISCFWGC